MRWIIFNPETGTPVRTVDHPSEVQEAIERLSAVGGRVAPLMAEPMDRTWQAAWTASLVGQPRGRHEAGIVYRPNPVQPKIPGVTT